MINTIILVIYIALLILIYFHVKHSIPLLLAIFLTLYIKLFKTLEDYTNVSNSEEILNLSEITKETGLFFYTDNSNQNFKSSMISIIPNTELSKETIPPGYYRGFTLSNDGYPSKIVKFNVKNKIIPTTTPIKLPININFTNIESALNDINMIITNSNKYDITIQQYSTLFKIKDVLTSIDNNASKSILYQLNQLLENDSTITLRII